MPVMEPDQRWHLAQAMGSIISEISEDNWAAGWMSGCEDIVPQNVLWITSATTKTPQIRAAMSLQTAHNLLSLRTQLGHWATYDPEGPATVDGGTYLPHLLPDERLQYGVDGPIRHAKKLAQLLDEVRRTEAQLGTITHPVPVMDSGDPESIARAEEIARNYEFKRGVIVEEAGRLKREAGKAAWEIVKDALHRYAHHSVGDIDEVLQLAGCPPPRVRPRPRDCHGRAPPTMPTTPRTYPDGRHRKESPCTSYLSSPPAPHSVLPSSGRSPDQTAAMPRPIVEKYRPSTHWSTTVKPAGRAIPPAGPLKNAPWKTLYASPASTPISTENLTNELV